jgi:hypothetical protein
MELDTSYPTGISCYFCLTYIFILCYFTQVYKEFRKGENEFVKHNKRVKQMNNFNMKSTEFVLVSHRNENPLNMCENSSFLFPAMYLIQNTQRYYEIHSLLLPICTVATAVKTIYKCCGRVSGCSLNPHSQSFL